MSDWDSLAAEVGLSSARRAVCGVTSFLGTLPPEAVHKVQDVIEGSGSATAVSTALAKRVEGTPSAWTIRAHRRGECSCRKTGKGSAKS